MKPIPQHWIRQPKNLSFGLKLKDVQDYKYLLCQLVQKDIIAFYKQTILGPLWFFIQPLLTMVVFIFAFSKFARISTDGLPQSLFYLSGIITWNYFAECLNKTSTFLKDNHNILSKVYFPRIIIPLSISISLLARFGLQLLLFFITILLFHQDAQLHFNWAVGLFPLLIILMAAFGLGCGLTIAALTAKYRDLIFLIAFGLQLLMYTTTVIYPLSSAPLSLKLLIQINPMTTIIETFRYAFLGKGSFSWAAIFYCTAASFCALFIGLKALSMAEKTFADTI